MEGRTCSSYVTENLAANNELDLKTEEFSKKRDHILLLERVILHTIGFELSIDHPYKFLLEKINKLIFSPALQFEVSKRFPKNNTTQKTLQNELIQIAMNFANDSMHTSLCLQFPPEMIATSCVYMSAQYCGITGIKGHYWLDILDGGTCKMDILTLICKFSCVVYFILLKLIVNIC